MVPIMDQGFILLMVTILLPIFIHNSKEGDPGVLLGPVLDQLLFNPLSLYQVIVLQNVMQMYITLFCRWLSTVSLYASYGCSILWLSLPSSVLSSKYIVIQYMHSRRSHIFEIMSMKLTKITHSTIISNYTILLYLHFYRCIQRQKELMIEYTWKHCKRQEEDNHS